jgi:hypothetical protein
MPQKLHIKILNSEVDVIWTQFINNSCLLYAEVTEIINGIILLFHNRQAKKQSVICKFS